MSYLRLFLIFIMGISTTCSFGQKKIEGYILDSLKIPAPNCYVLLLSQENVTLDYIVPNELGYYSFNNLDGNKNFGLRVQGINFQTINSLVSFEEDSIVRKDFILKRRINSLDEVILISERKPISVKNDTTRYNLKHFKNVNDTKLVDVLENLPGVTVDKSSGQIQFKGKPIETILLEGDNLFGKSYAIGSRNIPTDIVSEVEAIEDYHDNKFTKGIKKSNKVVLNLKLNEDVASFSGETAAALGYENHFLNISGLNISKRIKGFGVLGFNDISQNNTSFQRQTYNLENAEEIQMYASDFFQESNLKLVNSSSRSYINDIKSFSYNNLFKVSKNARLKTDFALMLDENYSEQVSNVEIIIDGQTITRNNKITENQNPFFVKLINEFYIDLTPNLQFRYSNKNLIKDNFLTQNNLQNENTNFTNDFSENTFFFNHRVNTSWKVDSFSVVDFDLVYSNDKNNQIINLTSLMDNQIIDNVDYGNQEVTTQKETLKTSLDLLRKIKKTSFNIGVLAEYVDERSSVVSNTNASVFDSSLKSNLFKSFGKLQVPLSRNIFFETELNVNFLDTKFSDIQENNFVFLTGSSNLKYKFNRNSLLDFSISRNSQFNNLYRLFRDSILVDSQNLISNDVNFELMSENIWRLTFSNTNVFAQSNFSVSGNYSKKTNSILSNQVINENISVITYSQNPFDVEDFGVSVSKGFYFDGINNKVRLGTSVSFLNYFTSLNELGIVKSSSVIQNFNVELKSAFDGFYNYNLNLDYTLSESKQESSLQEFTSTNINGRFKSIFKYSKKLFGTFETELRVPNNEKIDLSTLYFDTSLNYKRGKIKYFLLGKNILNNNVIRRISTTEFSTSISSSTIFERYIVLGVNFAF